MVVGLAAAAKRDAYFGVNAGAPLLFEVGACGEGQPVQAGRGVGGEIAATAVGVGRTFGEHQPRIFIELFEANANARGRLAEGYVQNVGRDSTHSISHFLKRIWVI